MIEKHVGSCKQKWRKNTWAWMVQKRFCMNHIGTHDVCCTMIVSIWLIRHRYSSVITKAHDRYTSDLCNRWHKAQPTHGTHLFCIYMKTRAKAIWDSLSQRDDVDKERSRLNVSTIVTRMTYRTKHGSLLIPLLESSINILYEKIVGEDLRLSSCIKYKHPGQSCNALRPVP